MFEIVKTVCPFCGQVTYIQLPAEDYAKWQAGALVQDAFPYLSPETREQLISGICESCWDSTFGGDSEDEEDWDEPSDWDLEMGFNPYEGCYDFDC